MPSLPLAFGLGQSSGVEELSGAPSLSANVLFDAGKAVRRRPAVVAWDDFPAPVTASPVTHISIFGNYVVFVTEDRKLHAWLAPGLVQELSDSTSASQLDGDRRPTSVSTATRWIVAGGGLLQKWDGGILSARLGGSPPIATHVVGISSRVVVNPRGLDQTVGWSEPFDVGHETWPGNLQVLDAKPDPVTAIWENTNELVGVGPQTTSFLVPDPTSGFVIQRVLNVGTVAPYCFASDDDNMRFLDHRKRITESDGRSIVPISDPGMTKTIRELTTVDDAWAFHVFIDAYSLAVFVFPTEGRAFVYNTGSKTWSEWRSRSSGEWAPFNITAYCYVPNLDLHLVGTSDGQIRKLSMEAVSDLDGVIVGEMRTGFQDQGTMRLKNAQAVKMRFRHTPGTTPRVALSWRDDTGEYGQPIYFDIEKSGQVEIRSLGTYRQRDWKLVIADESPVTLVEATIDYDQLSI
jgi:hypothetical protein